MASDSMAEEPVKAKAGELGGGDGDVGGDGGEDGFAGFSHTCMDAAITPDGVHASERRRRA